MLHTYKTTRGWDGPGDGHKSWQQCVGARPPGSSMGLLHAWIPLVPMPGLVLWTRNPLGQGHTQSLLQYPILSDRAGCVCSWPLWSLSLPVFLENCISEAVILHITEGNRKGRRWREHKPGQRQETLSGVLNFLIELDAALGRGCFRCLGLLGSHCCRGEERLWWFKWLGHTRDSREGDCLTIVLLCGH